MPQPTVLPTKFAPAERASRDEILTQREYFDDIYMVNSMLDAVPNMFLVLNQQRQIVYANQKFRATFGNGDVACIFGQRPGETFNCQHAFEEEGGCGTAESCATCGAVKAILAVQGGEATVMECRIAQQSDVANALDLRVWAKPLEVQGEPFTIFAVEDISDEKRLQALERIFFHDIINTAGAIQGLVNLLDTMTDPTEFHNYEFGKLLTQASNQLLDEIVAQRQLVAAERGELLIHPRPFMTRPLLEKVADLYSNHHVGFRKNVEISAASEDIEIYSDHAILGRVLSNLLKNALEASELGETVRFGCERFYDYVRFWVHNDGFMPRHVQLQVFKRSFSTKGEGRGLGTYGIRLLTEKYLQGRVSFASDKARGTTFSVMLPLLWLSPDTPEKT